MPKLKRKKALIILLILLKPALFLQTQASYLILFILSSVLALLIYFFLSFTTGSLFQKMYSKTPIQHLFLDHYLMMKRLVVRRVTKP